MEGPGVSPQSSGPAGQPIVLFGGFLTNPLLMHGSRVALAEVTGLPVFLVPARSHHWMRSVSRSGWARLVRLLRETVEQALTDSPTGKVTIVAHSAAGVVSRLYLGSDSFEGQTCGGHRVVGHLVTLGSPHYSEATYEARVRQWVDERYPGAYFAPAVRYTAVAGRYLKGREQGAFWERLAYRSYGALTGQGEDWGDGIVPLSSALLEGAKHFILDRAAHYWGLYGFRVPWYGSTGMIRSWWPAAWGDDQAQLHA